MKSLERHLGDCDACQDLGAASFHDWMNVLRSTNASCNGHGNLPPQSQNQAI